MRNVGVAPAASEHGLGCRELSNCNGLDVLRVRVEERLIELLIVLAVVADEDPLNIWKLGGESFQARALVVAPTAEETIDHP